MERMIGSQQDTMFGVDCILEVFQSLGLNAQDLLFAQCVTTREFGEMKPPWGHDGWPLPLRYSVGLVVHTSFGGPRPTRPVGE